MTDQKYRSIRHFVTTTQNLIRQLACFAQQMGFVHLIGGHPAEAMRPANAMYFEGQLHLGGGLDHPSDRGIESPRSLDHEQDATAKVGRSNASGRLGGVSYARAGEPDKDGQ